MPEILRISFVAGVTPDKWARTWREREPGTPLELSLVEQPDQLAPLRDGAADMAFVRLPVDREGLHLIPLYEELAVVVVPVEHPVAAYDEVTLADLADEQLVAGAAEGWAEGWDAVATAEPLPFPPMTTKQALEVVASGTGIAVVPMSVARLLHRKDLTFRPVSDVPPTRVGLAWPTSSDDPDLDAFVGVVRGRTVRSSRGEQQAGTKKGAAVGGGTPPGSGGRQGASQGSGRTARGQGRNQAGRGGRSNRRGSGGRRRG
ncbi:LysR family transcriptional regulator [Nocardioides guangzhouensis]|uniref:LysR family transcriptional regulator n=1 Tax=Nocardioides guangzhouensis TaxID=2497878 RepID=A0A4Q4ZIS0_9ACTN|nr:LysR family substrate-binding domain-containing protein [Nocardioides guangzhouensis]RYP87461.1 LysR family transcriptional regulator [Nocardioides guangzhouensis]